MAGLAEADFSHILRPLHRVRDKVTVLDGMAMTSAMLDPRGNNHGVSWAHLFTNEPANYDSPYRPGPGGVHPYPSTQSIDQYIAEQVAPDGLIPSVQWGTNGWWGDQVGYSTNREGAWLPLVRNPATAFERLMRNGLPTGGDPEPPSRRQLIQAQQGSVLDLAGDRYDALLPRLSGDDALKLELHRDEIRALETRLGGGPRTVTCDPDFMPAGETMESFFRLTKIALSCDVTRVVALALGELGATDFGAPAGSDVHQDWAHGTSDEAYLHMANYYRVHAEQFASLVSHLDEVPDGDGTLLDNTMVIWMTELATGGHDFGDCLTVVAGGTASGLNPGRYVRFEQNRPAPCTRNDCTRNGGIGPAHSHLFVSAMQHMEMTDTSFNLASGPAADGSTINLSGALEML